MNTFECVNGHIIGGELSKIILYSPNGNKALSKLVCSSFCMEDEAKKMKDSLLNEVIGSGKRLKHYPHLIRDMYGEGKWTVRMY